MKTILCIGATLMIGAGIYGFVDYKKTSRNKEFSKMYDSKEPDHPVAANDKTKKAVMPAEIKTPEESVKKNDFIEAKTTIDPTLQKNSDVMESKHTIKAKRLSYKLFSRAPLEEKYIDKELKSEPSKTDQPVIRRKNKDQ